MHNKTFSFVKLGTHFLKSVKRFGLGSVRNKSGQKHLFLSIIAQFQILNRFPTFSCQNVVCNILIWEPLTVIKNSFKNIFLITAQNLWRSLISCSEDLCMCTAFGTWSGCLICSKASLLHGLGFLTGWNPVQLLVVPFFWR